MIRPLATIVLALTASSCCVTVPLSLWGDYQRWKACPASYAAPNGFAWTRYPIRVDVVTPRGIKVDRSGFTVDLALLDAELAKAEECMGRPILACALQVKIAEDSVLTPGGWFFARDTRGTTQPPNVIVLTPDTWAFVHELVHLVMGWGDDKHDDPLFKRCGG